MAQIVTITNPLTGQPAHVDQLEHTAQQIDDAIDRAKAGGEIDTLLSNKAPAGYGLGVALSNENTITDCNDATACGWYISRGATNAPTWSTYGVLLVSARDGENMKTQVFFSSDSSNKTIISVRSGGSTWGAWECVNPPMVVGVEYRTTERYKNKPVYVNVVNCGEFATGATKRVAHGITMDSVVRAFGVRSNGESIPMTYTSNGTSYERINFMVGTSNVFITSENTASTGTLVVQIYYTKATD